MIRLIPVLLIAGYSLVSADASYDTLSGTVKDNTGAAVSGAVVSLKVKTSIKDTTDVKGVFSMVVPTTRTVVPYGLSNGEKLQIGVHSRHLQFSMTSNCQNATVSLYRSNGGLLSSVKMGTLNAGVYKHALPDLAAGFYIMQIALDNQKINVNLISNGKDYFLKDDHAVGGRSVVTTATAASSVDTIVTSKSGYTTAKTPIDSYTQKDVAIVLEKEGNIECKLPTFPATAQASSTAKENSKLPDPFTFYDGTKLTKKSQWACRRAEILAMAGKYLYGDMPAKPDEVTGTVSGGKITVNCKVGTKTASFNISASGSGDILCLQFSAGIGAPSGARTCAINGSNYISTIKSLYSNYNGGSLIAGAWAIERILDVLEANPTSGIDPKKVMVTGCSTWGKAAFIAGAYCERVALVGVVESGALGGASMRQTTLFRAGTLSYGCNAGKPQGLDNLEDGAANMGGPWVGSAASWLRSSPSKCVTLPWDQHLLLACIAPRPCVYLTNANKDAWCHLGATQEALSAWAAEPVWNALGVPQNFGFNMAGKAYNHCTISENSEHPALAKEFFKMVYQGDATAKTDVMGIKEAELYQPKSDWETKWIDWDMTTTLE